MLTKQLIAVLGMIIFGTGCSLIAKLIYSVEAPSIYGGNARFEKPWFQVFEMFVGMSVCILLELPKRRRAVKKPELEEDGPSASIWIIAIPAVLDLFATACGTSGLLFVTVSVYQMLRGAMLIFTAVLSVMFLGRKLTLYNWAGIALCVLGVGFVGLANVLGEKGGMEGGSATLGIALVLIGQVFQAVQTVVEEYLLRNLRMSSVRVVAWEGVFGMMHYVVWVIPWLYVLPGRDHGHMEDTLDAFYMFSHSWMVGVLIFLDMCFMLGYNLFGMQVTESLSGVHRVVIETLRTLAVWVIDLVIYYVISGGRLGEAWGAHSHLQLIGFTVLIGGTLLYNYKNVSENCGSKDEAVHLVSAEGASKESDYGSTEVLPQDVVITLGSRELAVAVEDDS